MFRKKSKKQPVRIEAKLVSGKKGEGYTKIIEIPVGYTVSKESFISDLIIKDSEGNVKQRVRFQAGFTITLDYFY